MTVTITVAKPETSHDGQDFARIFSFETVASYNWLDEAKPTILVPGQSQTINEQGHLLTEFCY